MSRATATKPTEKPAPSVAQPKPAPKPEARRPAAEALRRRLQPTPVWPD